MSEKYRYSKRGLEKVAMFNAFKVGQQARQTWNAVKPVVQNSKGFQEIMNAGRKGFNSLNGNTQKTVADTWNTTKGLVSQNVAKLNNWAADKTPQAIKQPWEQAKKGWGP